MKSFKRLLFIGIGLELIICLVSYFLSADLSEAFRYSARFSGRLSLIVFVVAMWPFARSIPSSNDTLNKTRTLTAVFAVLHFIHLFLLMMNVKLNSVGLIPHKLAGGILAYMMILLYPILFERIKNIKAVHSIYFLYVGFVMAMTYVARMKGDFEGSFPSLFHKLAFGLVLSAMVYFMYKSFFKRQIIGSGRTKDSMEE